MASFFRLVGPFHVLCLGMWWNYALACGVAPGIVKGDGKAVSRESDNETEKVEYWEEEDDDYLIPNNGNSSLKKKNDNDNDNDTADAAADGFPKFRFCRKCQTFKPPRTHHCSACNRCIMKMDHHCE